MHNVIVPKIILTIELISSVAEIYPKIYGIDNTITAKITTKIHNKNLFNMYLLLFLPNEISVSILFTVENLASTAI